MDLMLLEILQLFAETGTLSAVSERLHLTEPTVSRAMRKLEDILNVQLFERSKNRITLNDTGDLAVVYADRILKTAEEMRQHLQMLTLKTRQISLGSCAPGPLMELLPLVAGLYADLPVSHAVTTEADLTEGLRCSRYSLVLTTQFMDAPDLCCIPFVSETLNVSLDPDDRLAGQDSITFAEMDGREFVTYSDIGCWESIVRAKMPHARLYRQESMQAIEILACASQLPVFSTSITQRVLGPVNPSRIDVPITDAEAKLEFFLVLLSEDEKRFSGLLSMLRKMRGAQ